MDTTRSRDTLIDVALGRAPPDLVITGGQVANVYTREIYPADILIKGDRIAAVVTPGNVSPESGVTTVAAAGCVVGPGLIDPHVHIESSMITVTEYSRAVVPRGVTAVAEDPHEIGNVLGEAGIRLMFDEARHVPLKVMLRVPGRIPAMPEWIETSNGKLDLDDTKRMMDWEETVCLAGDINPALILNKDADQLAKIAYFARHGLTISGQSPGLAGATLNAYIAAGPEDSHVARNVAEIIENIRLGLRSIIALRPGRRLDRPHMKELADLIRTRRLDTRMLQFCTDDIHAHHLYAEGHLDHRLRLANEEGFDPLISLQMATINVAEGLRIDRDYGSVSPGKYADLVFFRDLGKVEIEAVLINGKIAFDAAGYRPGDGAPFRYPEWARQSVRVAKRLEPEDLMIRVPHNTHAAIVNCISATFPKERREVRLNVQAGVIVPDIEQDVAAIVVIDRHSGICKCGRGFISGMSLKRGAIAASVSHDAHNLFALGPDFADLALALNRLVKIGGGYAIALDGKIVCELPLPIAGLMSEAPLAEVAEQTDRVERMLVERLGCTFVTRTLAAMNFLCLPNMPHYGFTDHGLVDSHALTLVDPVVSLINAEE
jgi:adenine deaminase